MSIKMFAAFQNEADCIELGDLTIENRLDRVSIFGSIDIWKDKAGLKSVREIKMVIDQVVKALEAQELPEKVVLSQPETVKNPFA